MKELHTGQYTIAQMDYLLEQDREAEANILHAEVDEMKTYGLTNWADIMDLMAEDKYGEAFNYVEDNE